MLMKESNKQRTKRVQTNISLDEPLSEEEFNEIFAEMTLTQEAIDNMPTVSLNHLPPYPTPIHKPFSKWWIISLILSFGIIIAVLYKLLNPT